MNELTTCPSTLGKGYASYSPVALKRLFDGKKVSHIMPYLPISKDADGARAFMQNRKRLSISGAQSKYSMVARNGKIEFAQEQEQGRYIMKPVPSELRLPVDLPANENLTMQLAEQVFGIETAANGLSFFEDGEPVYITRRFDVDAKGEKLRMEDFASLAGIAAGSDDDDKYNSSYEALAELMEKYVPAWRIEMVKFFRQVLFNFLISNGDAHLKNFSILETPSGDFRLSPAYDILNTRIHVDDADLALHGGLFRQKHPEHFKGGTVVIGATFRAFGLQIGLPPTIVDRELAAIVSKQEEVETLIDQSYLSDKAKRTYQSQYRTRRNLLRDFKL